MDLHPECRLTSGLKKYSPSDDLKWITYTCTYTHTHTEHVRWSHGIV